VISEFLAGSFPFGTLANLNIGNHDLHEATLPVLFETVLFDRIQSYPLHRHPDIAPPAGFRYTRLVFVVEDGAGLT
jgi:hypothetical protein